jgi:hypothetical protein
VDFVFSVWFLRHTGINFVPIESKAQRRNAKEVPMDLGGFQVTNVENLHLYILPTIPASAATASSQTTSHVKRSTVDSPKLRFVLQKAA